MAGYRCRRVISAGKEHRLHGVVIAVVIVAFHLHVLAAVRGVEAGDIFQAARDVVAVEHAGVIKSPNPGRRSRKPALAPAAASGGLITESAVGILATDDVLDRFVDHIFFNFDARIARGAGPSPGRS